MTTLEDAMSDMHQRMTALLQRLHAGGNCPCARPRVRDYIIWEDSYVFRDRETLWLAWRDQLEETERGEGNQITFRCKVCGSLWLEHWQDYSIMISVFGVTLSELGDVTETGSPPDTLRPTYLRHYGHAMDGVEARHREATPDEVIAYLEG